jgi:hypothetical protein
VCFRRHRGVGDGPRGRCRRLACRGWHHGRHCGRCRLYKNEQSVTSEPVLHLPTSVVTRTTTASAASTITTASLGVRSSCWGYIGRVALGRSRRWLVDCLGWWLRLLVRVLVMVVTYREVLVKEFGGQLRSSVTNQGARKGSRRKSNQHFVLPQPIEASFEAVQIMQTHLRFDVVRHDVYSARPSTKAYRATATLCFGIEVWSKE